jgi:hypothetical protein
MNKKPFLTKGKKSKSGVFISDPKTIVKGGDSRVLKQKGK